MEAFYPFIMTWPCTCIILAIAQHLLNLSRRQIFCNGHLADKRCAHDALVLKRQGQQDWDAFIRAALVLAGDIEHHIFPTILPVPWQVILYPLRTFCQQKEFYIRPLLYDCPCFIPPRVSLLQKEIRCHADPYHFPAFHLVLTTPNLGKRIFKPCLRPVNLRTILLTQRIQIVHITVLASFATPFAAMPGIPYIVQGKSPHFSKNPLLFQCLA